MNKFLKGKNMSSLRMYLVSDSTGETVSAIVHSAIVQFQGLVLEEHVWPLVRTESQLDKMLMCLKEKPGMVFYTIVDPILTEKLHKSCAYLKVPCLSVLSYFVEAISRYTNTKITAQPGKQYEMSHEYFSRMEAINYTLLHDDGLASWNLGEADIILVGVSRTSKTPTSVYLAYRGYFVANIPYVPPFTFPDIHSTKKPPLIVGLTISPDRLVQIRNNRMHSLDHTMHKDGQIGGFHPENIRNMNYIDAEAVRAEIKDAKRLCAQKGWPVIDVTRRSVEETAATIIQLYNRHNAKLEQQKGEKDA